MKPYALVITHNRHAQCSNLLNQLGDDYIPTVVIDNASNPRLSHPWPSIIQYDKEQPPNLSRLWNEGLDIILNLRLDNYLEAFDYSVTIFNDDVSIPRGFCQKMADKLEEHDVDIAFPDQFNVGVDVVDKSPPQTCRDMTRRMTGYCFTLRGSNFLLRANEKLRWWCGDNDIEMKARQHKGTVMVGRVSVEHSDPNGWTTRNELLGKQAGIDVDTFEDIWGFRAF